ncbi:Ig domain-containing protein [Clostridium perfringens]
MALKYLPPLPEGLHPFYCIFETTVNRDKNQKVLVLVSADTPLTYGYYRSSYIGFLRGSFATNQRYNSETKKWENGEIYTLSNEKCAIVIDQYQSGNCIYTNFDIIDDWSYSESDKHIAYKKAVDATEININGGDIRNMQKGMIWNVGQAITINPPEAPQICTFSSSNPDVCTVDETGKIVAVGEGECIITITSKM